MADGSVLLPESPDSDIVNTRITARYSILGRLGRGGTGEVFLVYDRAANKRVALKRLWHEHLSKPRITARFAREVQISRKMKHPAIVQVHDAARDEEDLFYTMDYIEGANLRTWMHLNGKCGVEAAVRAVSIVARALEHCHRHTIHRDVSPENIMVSPRGAITLIDFGLAKRHGCTDGLTVVNTSLGRLEYNAPEQERNASGVNHQADLYPLGIIFYEMLTHFRTPREQALATCRPEIGTCFDGFLERALAEDARDRYRDASELQSDLLAAFEAYKHGAPPVQAQLPRGEAPVSGWRRFWRRIGRRLGFT